MYLELALELSIWIEEGFLWSRIVNFKFVSFC